MEEPPDESKIVARIIPNRGFDFDCPNCGQHFEFDYRDTQSEPAVREIRGFPKWVIAREWILFLALLPFGAITCFRFAYNWQRYTPYGRSGHTEWVHTVPNFDRFWNEGFGLFSGSAWAFFTWLLPYLAVMLIRSIIWSSRFLSRKTV